MTHEHNQWRTLMRAIDRAMDQREKLGNMHSTPGRIRRPVGMKTREYDRRIRRLREAEATIKKLSPKLFKLRKPTDEQR